MDFGRVVSALGGEKGVVEGAMVYMMDSAAVFSRSNQWSR